MPVRKLTFEEAWETSTVFFVDDDLEDEIDKEVANLLDLADSPHLRHAKEPTLNGVIAFLQSNPDGLNVVLRDIGLSDEKFKRIISLFRKIDRIPGGFEGEWTITKIKRQLETDSHVLDVVARLLFDGKYDTSLHPYIPRYYLTKLSYREIGAKSHNLRDMRYKDALIGTYGGKKGYYVEGRIKQYLDAIEANYGIGYEQGKSRIINVDLDFAIPSLQDPWVIIMSSFQETTSSGQTTKARDMRAAYTDVEQSNSRNNEKRAFVNFVDGGGWLARKRDMQRLVNESHYFLNLRNLHLLEEIVLQYTPKDYRLR